MNHGWQKKRLGDVCKIKTGKLDANAKVENGQYPFFTCDASPYRINEYAFDDEAILISGNGNGHVHYYNGKFNAYQRTYVLTNFSLFFTPYLVSYMKGYMRRYFFECKKGGCIPFITLPILTSFPIPYPSIEVQKQIVSELDKLNELIELKRNQLKDLDTLAQSLFYETFGDPITNPKGWPIQKLSHVSELINGRAYKQNELLDSGKYRVIRVGNFFTNSDFYYSDLELPAEKYIENGDLIFAWSASFGAFIWQGEKVIYHYHIWKVLFDKNVLNKIFYKFLLNEMTSSFMNDLHGIGMMHLTKIGMEQYLLPIPPITLQEEFAKRIDTIEKQKRLIESSIADLETLLASRMDYWFND